jgi:phage tail sheath gpL-like
MPIPFFSSRKIMATLIVTIDTNKAFSEYTKAGQKTANGNRLIDLVKGLNYGALLGSVFVQGSSTSPVAASGTITQVSPVSGNTVTIAGVTLTAATDWAVAGTDTEDATALAAAINANTTLNKIVYATSAVNVVTVTALQRGVIGNYISLARVGAPITVSGTALANGAGGATSVPEQIV